MRGAVPLTTRLVVASAAGRPLASDPVGGKTEQSEPDARYTLCRCGCSKNKPFCDGTHADIGFEAP